MLSKQLKVVFFVSFAILILGVVMAAWGFNKIVEKKLKENLQLESSSPMFERWRKLPVPLGFHVYMFNVTNPEEVSNGAKPELKELGPYVYDEYREKTVLGYGANDTVQYMLQKKFYYNANKTESMGFSEDDDVTVIHFSYLAAILTVHDMMPSLVSMVNDALQLFFSDLTDPFLRVKVKDLLFDGIFLNCTGDNTALGLVCGKIRAETPPTMRPADDGTGFYFSMFGHMNLTASGPYSVKRGTEDVYQMGTVVGYQNNTVVPKWGNTYCNMINGSDGAINPPIRGSQPPMRLYSFQPDLCRSVYVTYTSKLSVDSLQVYKYEVDETVLASKSAVPTNKCFCRKNWSSNHDGCLLMGVMNLMACQGAPAVVSWPHFHLASEELLEYFADGIKPDKERHGSYMLIHPTTGVVLEGAQRIQFSIELRNIPAVPQLASVRTGLFPLLWIDENAKLSASIKSELEQSQTLLNYVEVSRWSLLTGSIVLFIYCSYLLASRLRLFSRSSNSVTFIRSPNTQNFKH